MPHEEVVWKIEFDIGQYLKAGINTNSYDPKAL